MYEGEHAGKVFLVHFYSTQLEQSYEPYFATYDKYIREGKTTYQRFKEAEDKKQ